jgi:uncharacterized protein YgfB (UPF0149 family)
VISNVGFLFGKGSLLCKLTNKKVQLSDERISELQKLLKEQLDKEYNDEDARSAALAIIHFIKAKRARQQQFRRPNSLTEEVT